MVNVVDWIYSYIRLRFASVFFFTNRLNYISAGFGDGIKKFVIQN